MKKFWLVTLLLVGLTACGKVPEQYVFVQTRVYRDVFSKQKAELDSKGMYSNIALAQDDIQALKQWSIEASFEFSEDKKQYILVFLDTRNRNTSYLDQDGYTWNGNLKPGESAFQKPREHARKFF